MTKQRPDPATLVGAFEDVDPSDIPARVANRVDPSMEYFDSLVSTAPRDKARKYHTTPEKARGLVNRFGRAVSRQNLREVFSVETGTEPDGRMYVVLRPRTTKSKKDAE